MLVPGSHGVDPPSLLAVSEEEALARLPADKSTQIFTYCASGRRANKVETALRALGFSQVTSCGGIEHMLRSGLAPAMCQNADPEQSDVTVRQLFDRESCTYTYMCMCTVHVYEYYS